MARPISVPFVIIEFGDSQQQQGNDKNIDKMIDPRDWRNTKEIESTRLGDKLGRR